MSAQTRIIYPGRVLKSTRSGEWCAAVAISQQSQPFQFSPSNLSTPTRRSNSSYSTPNLAQSAPPLPPLESRQPQALQQSQTWFNSNFPLRENELGTDPDKPPDERKVKLGKTLRILQEHLPDLLQKPLPQEILSPNISLHLFPSTHPHLPTVSGRVAYIAALWSSPIAWNRVPIIGNVKLEILSERMVKQPPVYSVPRRAGAYGEQLVVRWRTVGKSKNWGLPFIGNGNGSGKKDKDKTSAGADAISSDERKVRGGVSSGNESTTEVKAPVGMAEPVGSSKEFTGLFIFDFDKEGRILSHTIEHVQEGGQWEKGVGAKVVGLTDWLLGGMKGSEGGDACPAFSRRRR
ncbi:hypothetical protein V8F20_000190 [Naviculisporaceae sp. PSN 640]